MKFLCRFKIKFVLYWKSLKGREMKDELLYKMVKKIIGFKNLFVYVSITSPWTKKKRKYGKFHQNKKNKWRTNYYIKWWKKMICFENFFGYVSKNKSLNQKMEKQKIHQNWSGVLFVDTHNIFWQIGFKLRVNLWFKINQISNTQLSMERMVESTNSNTTTDNSECTFH